MWACTDSEVCRATSSLFTRVNACASACTRSSGYLPRTNKWHLSTHAVTLRMRAILHKSTNSCASPDERAGSAQSAPPTFAPPLEQALIHPHTRTAPWRHLLFPRTPGRANTLKSHSLTTPRSASIQLVRLRWHTILRSCRYPMPASI